MKKLVILALVSCITALPIFKNTFQQLQAAKNHLTHQLLLPSKSNDNKSHIQVALLLDTSNSMDGLIDQAKSQLWKMVNELATAKKDAVAPDIEIALYHYGNSSLSVDGGYVQQIVPLTSDLDLVSEKLFELKTSGGDEYCGWVIQDATKQLTWSDNAEDLKIIIIAGNEPFSQGPVNFKESCKAAITKGIMINTIHCGDYQKGITDLWKEGADLADGKYLNINQDDQVVHIPTPYDNDIIRLNEELNKTYIGYGAGGAIQAERQMTQDANAANYGAANARTRASFKAKESYSNASWDLVDAAKEDEEIIATAAPEDLPEEMKDMTVEQRKEYVDTKSKERESIKKEILDLEKQANVYVAQERLKNSEKETLDNVLISTVKEQAEKKSFNFNN